MESNLLNIKDQKSLREWYKKNVSCVSACPLNIRIENIIENISSGNVIEAIKTIFYYNPFPSITGRLCKYPCENACMREHTDGAVQIRNIERYLGDYILEHSYTPAIKKNIGKKILIIGAGISGLSVAYFLRVVGFDVDVFEKEEYPWGNLRLIPEFELEKDILEKEIKKIKKMGINISFSKLVSKDEITNDFSKKYDAILIAIGNNNLKDNSNIKINGMINAIDYLEEFKQKGKCEFLGNKVIILGINQVNLLCARLAIRHGSKYVEMYYNGSKGSINISDKSLREARQEGTRMNYYSQYTDIILDENKTAKKIEFAKTKIDVRTRKLIKIKGSEFIIHADCIVYSNSNNNFSMDKKQNLITDDNLKTNHKTTISENTDLKNISLSNVFHFNELSEHETNVVDIIGSAKNISNKIYHHLFNRTSIFLSIASNLDNSIIKTKKSTIDGNNSIENKATKCKELTIAQKIKSFDPVFKIYSDNQVKKECFRCLRCNNKIIINDINSCISCGICVDICPTNYFEQNKIIHSFIQETQSSYGNFLQKLFGLSNEDIDNYYSDYHTSIKKDSICIRCLKCVNNCSVNIISIVKINLIKKV